MEKIISLVKTDFNTTFGISSIAYSFKNKKNRWKVIGFGLAMLSLLPTYFILIQVLSGIYDTYNKIGQRSMFLLTGFLMSQIMVFVFGLLYVMSKYYFSNDLSNLVPLPIKPSYIVGSKFATLMVSEYLTSLPIILPFIFIYGIKGGEGIVYWIYSFILVAMLPVIPLVLSSIVIMIFMKYTNIGAKKDLMRTIGAVLFIIVMIFIQLKINTLAQKGLIQGDDFLVDLIKDSTLMVRKLGLVFPPSMWAALSLSNSLNLIGLVHLFTSIVIGVTSFGIMIFLSENLFFDGLIGNIEVATSRGRARKNLSVKGYFKERKPYLAIAKKEIIMLLKTPVYLLNSIGGVIMVPIILFMSTISNKDDSIGVIIELIESKQEFIALAGIGFIVVLGMLNSIGVTTFSREGKNFWIQRTLPIKVEDQIIGRVLASLAVQVLGLISILGSLAFIIKIQISTIILIALLGLLGSIPMTEIGMVIDIIRPLLTWSNPQQAMKQNLNVLIGMSIGSLYAGGIGYLMFKIIGKVDMSLIFAFLGLIFIVSAIGLYYVLKKLITKQFQVLE